MKCNQCNRDIERPLELYNGRWRCPSCKKDIFPDLDTAFAITARNRELFVRSEEYYFKWLTSSEESKSTRFKYLDKAVSLCCESAFEYHPSALMRMGYYYDRGYADFNTSSAERWRVAYFYYRAVLFNTHKGVSTAEGEETYVDDLTKIKLQCGEYMLALLRDIPPQLAGLTSFDGFEGFDKLRRAVAQKVKDLGGSIGADEGVSSTQPDASSMAFATLRACVDEERAPVFAIFKLSKGECQKLFSQSSDDFSIAANVGRDLRLKIAEAFDDKEIDGRFIDFRSSNALVEYAQNKCPERDVYLCFFNWLGGHKYLKKKKDRLCVMSGLEENYNAAIKMLIRAGRYNSCVFYDDDFFRFDEGRKGLSKKEMDRFVKVICGEDKA